MAVADRQPDRTVILELSMIPTGTILVPDPTIHIATTIYFSSRQILEAIVSLRGRDVLQRRVLSELARLQRAATVNVELLRHLPRFLCICLVGMAESRQFTPLTCLKPQGEA